MNATTTKEVKKAQRNQFLERKRDILNQLKSKLNKNMMKAIDLPIDRKLKTNLGISTKANIYQARGNKKIVGVKGGYASRYTYVAKLAKTLKVGGYIASFIGTAQTMYEAYAMCTIEPNSLIAKKYNLSQNDLDDACAYQTSQSVAKSAGLAAGGMAGGYAGYLLCNAIFSVETAGTSVFWCALVVVGVAAAGVSYGGAEGMSWLLDKIEEDGLKNEIYLQGKTNASKISKEEDLYR